MPAAVDKRLLVLGIPLRIHFLRGSWDWEDALAPRHALLISALHAILKMLLSKEYTVLHARDQL